MNTFPRITASNPNGRPRGSCRINQAKLRRAVNVAVEPHTVELLQRAVEKALGGDSVALAALLGVIAEAMRLADGAQAPA